ncbi:hypothetical protein [Bacillus sp. Hm123]|uniref:hypothetical protein n=1 Tax=Bacillus sp. Hm123 TaxID=3450745 RepID=UPI003F43C158
MNRLARRARKVAKKLCNHEAMVFRKQSIRKGNQWIESFVLLGVYHAQFYTINNYTRKGIEVVSGHEETVNTYKVLVLEALVKAGDRVVPVFQKGVISDDLLFDVSGEPVSPSFLNTHLEVPLKRLDAAYEIQEKENGTILVMKG